MHYLVTGEMIEEALAGKTREESAMYVQHVVKPSLEALEKLVEEDKVVGGMVAGARDCAFIIDAESNSEVGKLLGNLPFWADNRWSVTPLQSFQSKLDQVSESAQTMRTVVVEN